MPDVEINAKDVMQLRQKTGLPMMKCKEALLENGGDPVAAEEWLRKKLKGKMETRTDRAAGEGRVAVAIEGAKAAIIELRAETDFTAKNDKFVEAAHQVATKALAGASIDELNESISDLKIETGENISVSRAEVAEGAGFGSYVHHDGKTGVLLVCDGPVEESVGKQIGMHIVSAVPIPQGVTKDDVPESVIEKERQFALSLAEQEGKPKEIAEKMVEGKVRKLYSELALIEQDFVIDPSKKVKDVLGSVSATKFFRFQVGEGADSGADA
ncbi:MAG: translation elongation factor Ts [Planctomycetota bacterium]